MRIMTAYRNNNVLSRVLKEGLGRIYPWSTTQVIMHNSDSYPIILLDLIKNLRVFSVVMFNIYHLDFLKEKIE